MPSSLEQRTSAALCCSGEGQWHGANLEGVGQQGQVDVLPAHGVEEGGGGMHRSRYQVPVLGDQDDAALQEQASQEGQQGLGRDVEEQAGQGNAGIPGPIAAVRRDLELDEVLVAAAGQSPRSGRSNRSTTQALQM